MTGDDPSSVGSLQIARRLVASAVTSANGGDPRAVGAALQKTCTRVIERLSDALGDDGCNALLSRALARTEAFHPALKGISRLDQDGIRLDGVVETIQTTSTAEVRVAVEALFGALVDVLGHVIGEDMAVRIIDQNAHSRNGDKPDAV